MNKKTLIVACLLGAALVLGALWYAWKGGVDRFDYAAAFEQVSQSAGAPLVDVSALVGRTPAEVETLLGSPSECEQALHSLRCDYAQSPVQIVFIDGRADWFTVRVRESDLPFASQSLARFGLPVSEPAQQTEQESVWRDIAGFKEVRMVGDEYGVSHVRIKAITP